MVKPRLFSSNKMQMTRPTADYSNKLCLWNYLSKSSDWLHHQSSHSFHFIACQFISIKFDPTTSKSLHWLKINECIEYIFLRTKLLHSAQPTYLYNLICFQPLMLLYSLLVCCYFCSIINQLLFENKSLIPIYLTLSQESTFWFTLTASFSLSPHFTHAIVIIFTVTTFDRIHHSFPL